jgi:hypothetical protein
MREDQDQGSEQDHVIFTAREAAKHFLRSFVLDDWTLKAICAKPLRADTLEYEARSGPRELEDWTGEPRTVKRGELAILRVGGAPCFVLFEIADIKAELHDEARGYQQKTLADIFTQQQDQAAAAPAEKKKRPAIYRSYYGGRCQNPACGEELGLIETEGGRDRQYCSDKCRVAAHRAREREKHREQVLQYNSELRDYWKEHGIRGEVLLRLQEILLQYGKPAAKAATNVVLVALTIEAQAGSSEQGRLVEEVMLGGERIGFEEVICDEFRIPAGFEGWSEFVSHASLTRLRLVRGYLYEREHQQYYKEQARKRLTELSRDPEP